MLELTAICLAIAIAAPLAGARLIAKGRDARRTSVLSIAASLLALFLAAVLPRPMEPSVLTIGTLGAAPFLVLTAIVLAIVVSASKLDIRPEHCQAWLLCLAGSLMVYAGDNLLIIFIGWVLSAAPFVWGSLSRTSYGQVPWYWRPQAALGASIAALAIVVVLMATTSNPVASLSNWNGPGNVSSVAGATALSFTTLAALIRSGVFPFHRWSLAAVESESILPYTALFSAHLGVALLARVALPLFPEAAVIALPYVSYIALFSALVTAFMALGTNRPRRILALVASSQSAFVISGLESRNVEGIAGALLQWLVVSVCTAGLVIVYRALEVRTGGQVGTFAGLGEKAPRMAVFFLLIALSLVGLPGTLGFCAEDLLFHGALEAHPFLGVALPLATALNAIHLYRLFSTLFLGRHPNHAAPISDTLPRERWCLAAIVTFLVVTGVAPQLLITSRSNSAQSLMRALASTSAEHIK